MNNNRFKHLICIGTFLFLLGCCLAFANKPFCGESNTKNQTGQPDSTDVSADDGYEAVVSVYAGLNIERSVCSEAFLQGVEGFQKISGKRKNILAIADFSKPSTAQRFVVIDMDTHKVLFVTHVAHGRGSGANYAESFSNVSGSHKSSLGFYLTDSTYDGRNGYSLLLNGLEKGINDKARERAIVMHGAEYCDPEIISHAGRLGRSLGCPALPLEVNGKIIDIIKDGAVLFIYADNDEYRQNSTILNDWSSQPGAHLAQTR